MSANYTPNQNKYKNLTPFKTWLLLQINTWGLNNFPFVESDFDELTNYGMMMKLMKALDDVISNQNEVEQDMTNLFNAFTELQSYVNNYFDNLDVQDEINTKLDEMVEAGTLQEIIADYLNSKAIFGYDTIADMKSATNLIDGSYAKTLGFYTKNDGGMATYKIRKITNSDIVNEMDIIALNDDTLIAELIAPSHNINPQIFGAKFNGTDNDTIYFENALKYGNILCPSNKITFINNLSLNSNDCIDFNNCIVKINSKGIIINAISNAEIIKNIEIKNARFETTSNATNIIEMYQTIFTKIINCYWNTPTINCTFIHCENCYNITIDKCCAGASTTSTSFITGSKGIAFVSTTDGGVSGTANGTNIKVIDCLLQYLDNGIYVHYTNNGVLDTSNFNNLGLSGCNIGLNLDVSSTNKILGLTIDTIRCEYCNTGILNKGYITLINAFFYNRLDTSITCINNSGRIVCLGTLTQAGTTSILINNTGQFINSGIQMNCAYLSDSTYGTIVHNYSPFYQTSLAGTNKPFENYVLYYGSNFNTNELLNPTENQEIIIIPSANIVLTLGNHTYQLTAWKKHSLIYFLGAWRITPDITMLT